MRVKWDVQGRTQVICLQIRKVYIKGRSGASIYVTSRGRGDAAEATQRREESDSSRAGGTCRIT